MQQYGIGQAVRRKEDVRFTTGAGCYIDDLKPDGLCYAAVLRSPYAHAEIRALETKTAAQMPGILAVLTGADWRTAGWGDIPSRTPAKNIDGKTPVAPPRPGLAVERVRFVGDAVALVVTETPQLARDALELIEVDYEELAAVVDPVVALKPNAPQVWPQVPENLCLRFETGDKDKTEALFVSADHVVSLNLVNNRVTAVSIEPRGALATYDSERDSYTLIASTQNIHANRKQLAEDVLHIEADKLRALAYDVGGGFGVKNALYPEYGLVLFAAHKVQRPVKWISDRSEAFLSDTHGREQHSQVELALTKAGDFLALRVQSVGNTGAYMATIGPFTASGGSARTQGGPYQLQSLYFSSRVAYTHTSPTDPYRGAGRPEASYVIERIIDVAAAELGFDPVELRRRNAIRPEQLPYKTPTGAEIDSGDFPAVLEKTLVLGDWQGFAGRAALSRQAGKRRGIGLGLYFECTGGAPTEYASLSFTADGSAQIAIGTHSTGMGHETVMAQIVADRLGLLFDTISFRQADTDATPSGGGHGGSRSVEVGGGAILAVAAKVIEKAKHIAAHQLEAALADLEFNAGEFRIAGTDRVISMQELVKLAHDPAALPESMEPGLDDNAVFERSKISFPNGCHLAEVEVDPETGVIKLLNYAIVDDFGTIMNPLLADGQVMGGTVQGIGQAMLEQIVYEPDSGQLVTGSLMDYCLPRADEIPPMRIAYYEDAPTTHNPLGVKGAGEAGCVGAPPALVNAVVNALQEYGVRHIEMPLTPEKVWRAIQG